MKHTRVIWLLCLAACSSHKDAPAGTPTSAARADRGVVVANVNGDLIYAADVARYANSAGVDGKEALSALVDEALLVQKAIGELAGGAAAVAPAEDRVLVQTLLKSEVEGAVAAENISEEDLRAAYHDAGERFVRPERRGSVHVLAQIPKTAPPELVARANTWIRSVISEMYAEGGDAVVARYQHAPPTDLPFQVRAEAVPPYSRTDSAAQPYLDAIFATDPGQVVPEPVRSDFGVHAIFVKNVVAAETRSFDDARAELTTELVNKRRTARYNQLVGELTNAVHPEYNEAAISRALANDALSAP